MEAVAQQSVNHYIIGKTRILMIQRVLFVVCFLLMTTTAQASGGEFTVHSEGALRSVHHGDFSGQVPLAQFSGRDNIFAVGPVAGLDGEVTAIDGEFHIARVRDGEIKTDADLSSEAAFLVWAEVNGWQPSIPLGENVRNHSQLEKVVEELATEAGADTTKPFPFLIEGAIESVEYHILAPPEHGGGADHKESAVNIKATDVDARIIGFFSRNHEGVFTHRGSYAHLHLVEDGGKSGHVDDLSVSADTHIRFPE